jgi:inorganic pyrophosphatase
LLQVVIEIPAGTNEKWEVNKQTGQLEWQKISEDSMRVVDYLPYPANYGFVPRTHLPKEAGGDGDPVDVLVLGPSVARGTLLKVQLIGIIHMLDQGEGDAKLLAVVANEKILRVESLAELEERYPGILDILSTWLKNYKGKNSVTILGADDKDPALRYLEDALNAFENKSKD